MTLTSATKYTLILFLLISCSVWCQTEDSTKDQSKETTKESNSFLDYGVKGSFGVAYNFINPAGDKYIGLAYEGKGGYALKFKLFVYRGFFVGGSTGFSYFENINPEVTGNYDKTKSGFSYLFIGYEFRPSEKIAIGISSNIFGESSFKNEYNGTNEAFQVDKAKTRAFEANVDYFISSNFSINLSYTYRNDKTKIRTSSNLQSRFDRAQFSIIGLGVNFQFGKDAIISNFNNKNTK